jgi:hypothetical protein
MQYHTHDNGGRPYNVIIDSNTNKVIIYKHVEPFGEGKYIKKKILFANKIFIGKSPDLGDYFDGNSILLHIKDNEYVFIGREIFSFTSLKEITKFYSPVGNNDVPYPYAYDGDNCYLFCYKKIILNFKSAEEYDDESDEEYDDDDDPYDYYHNDDSLNILDMTVNIIESSPY